MASSLNEEFQDYQTDILFVLVGENPLPNYVAANILLRKGGHLYLVHSAGPVGTGKVAARLAKHLTEYTTHLVPVNEHHSGDLRAEVEKCLDGIPEGSVGLNYTGGTKFMSVHTHQVVLEKFCHDKYQDFVLSYLHADTLELAVEAYRDKPAKRRRVVDAVSLTFKDLFALHGLELREELHTEPQLPDLAGVLVRINSTPKGVEGWRDCRELLFKKEDPPAWSAARAKLSGKGVAEADICALETALGLQGPLPADLDGTLRNWLDGGWLEDWTLTCLKGLDCEQRFRNLKGWIPGKTPDDKPRTLNFEIDVGVLRGYQLFALSCKARKNRSDAKLGLMEIFARSRQMGGEEARAALVMTQTDADAMAQELSSDWGVSKRIRVFGCGQLLDLQGLLKSWLDER